MTDLYRVLGVSRRATESEIKSAYRMLARRYHPDVCSSPDANARFARITEAYRVLSDRDRRSMYDLGVPLERKTTYYASRSAEVVAYQRKLDHLVDEMIARDRKETAERSHAVTIVVTLFISAFMVAAAKPNIIEELNKPGKIAIIALSGFAVWHLVKNVSVALARYTYTVPRNLVSVFKAEAPPDKTVSRTAALVFLISGYLVSLGLGYLLHTLTAGRDRAPGTFLGVFLYPPIAVLIISTFRRMGGFLDKS